ncbi:SrfA family protein [Desulfovibrio sp. OttesenSCG-928-A18]|nr:SrfA family protein [Desulfovibrio sp. OttesenSCG-928-A18]
MAATLIATTERGSFNALRFQGILITESYAQISSMLGNQLSPEHGMMFAEPVHTASGTSTDWYSPVEGKAVPLADLDLAEQNAVREKMAGLAKDISELAESLKEDGNSSKKIRGNILSLALRYPGDEHIYLVGGQPVITCWGFAPGTIGAEPQDLVRVGMAVPKAPPPPPSAPVAPAPPPPPAPVAARAKTEKGFAWWLPLLWILLGLLLLLGLFLLAGLLFGPSGCVRPGLLPAGCAMHERYLPAGCSPVEQKADPSEELEDKTPAEKEPLDEAPGKKAEEPKEPPLDPALVSALTAEQEKERSLRRQIEDLRRELQERMKLCQKPQTRVEPKAEPQVEPKVEPRAEPQVEPKEEPKEEPPSLAELMPTSPEEPKEQRPSGEELRIPENASPDEGMRFLEGCWNSDSGLIDRETREPLMVQYCFDANGKGSRTISRSKKQDSCTGGAKARIDSSGRLIIDADSAHCKKGGGFVPQRVECSAGADGKTECKGKEQGGSSNSWDAQFTRK